MRETGVCARIGLHACVCHTSSVTPPLTGALMFEDLQQDLRLQDTLFKSQELLYFNIPKYRQTAQAKVNLVLLIFEMSFYLLILVTCVALLFLVSCR